MVLECIYQKYLHMWRKSPMSSTLFLEFISKPWKSSLFNVGLRLGMLLTILRFRQVHPGYFNFVTLILLWKRFHLHKLIEPGKYGTNGREKSIRKLLLVLETFEFSMRYLIGSLSIRLILQLKTSQGIHTCRSRQLYLINVISNPEISKEQFKVQTLTVTPIETLFDLQSTMYLWFGV